MNNQWKNGQRVYFTKYTTFCFRQKIVFFKKRKYIVYIHSSSAQSRTINNIDTRVVYTRDVLLLSRQTASRAIIAANEKRRSKLARVFFLASSHVRRVKLFQA